MPKKKRKSPVEILIGFVTAALGFYAFYPSNVFAALAFFVLGAYIVLR